MEKKSKKLSLFPALTTDLGTPMEEIPDEGRMHRLEIKYHWQALAQYYAKNPSSADVLQQTCAMLW